jgi:hypothetical protein
MKKYRSQEILFGALVVLSLASLAAAEDSTSDAASWHKSLSGVSSFGQFKPASSVNAIPSGRVASQMRPPVTGPVRGPAKPPLKPVGGPAPVGPAPIVPRAPVRPVGGPVGPAPIVPRLPKAPIGKPVGPAPIVPRLPLKPIKPIGKPVRPEPVMPPEHSSMGQ